MTLCDLNITYKKGELWNHVPLFLFERKGSPIKIQFRFKGGAAQDPQDLQGIAHFLEHMLVAGTASYSTKDALDQRMKQLGGNFEAFTNMEQIMVSFLIPTKHELPELTEIIEEIFSKTLFAEKTAEKERAAILAELGMTNSNPDKFMEDLYRKSFFGDSTLSQSILGTQKSLSKITINDLTQFKNNLITRDNVTIFCAGDIDLSYLTLHLSKLSLPEHSLKPIVTPTKGSPSHLSTHFPAQNVFLRLGYVVEKPTFKEYVALKVLQLYLAGSRSSSLIRKLRHEKGLVYGCSALLRFLEPCAIFFVATSCVPKYTEEVKNIIEEEFKNNLFDLPQYSLSEATSFLIKNAPFNYEKSSDILDSQINLLTYFDKPYLLDDYTQALKEITPEDINQIVKKNFISENYASAILVP